MSNIKEKIKKLPNTPGVYFFLGKNRRILYIGKATSLKSRVQSYFRGDIEDTRGPAIAKMISEVEGVKVEETDSVLEALVLEARLIKKHKPKYNVKERDDKSSNYIVITKEDFPRVILMRERELLTAKEPIAYKIGPFPQGGVLRDILKIVRKIFPFRDSKCKPNQGRPCFSRQIGLCPGVCTGEISQADYKKQIRNLKLFFEGKKKTVIKNIEKEMKDAAKRQEFERADALKKQIFSLGHIQDISLLKRSSEDTLKSGFRVEGYDVAHVSGSATVGVMTVVEDGEVQKNEYRKFNIKEADAQNDTQALAEILRRRFNHDDWRYPKLIVVDGGKAQKNIAEKVVQEFSLSIPVVSVVKNEKHRPREILGARTLRTSHEDEILLANNEAHRFALSFHRTKMRRR